MGSAKRLPHPSSTSKLPHSSAAAAAGKTLKKDPLLPLQHEHLRNTSTSSDTEEKNPNASSSLPPSQELEMASAALTVDGGEEDSVLCDAEFLTPEEVLRRRSRRVKQLARCYRDHYWALMEEVRVQYREYYWKYGKSPFKEEEEGVNGGGGGSGSGVEGSGENNRSGLGLGFGENNNDGKNSQCAFAGCKAKAMALTNYCHPHILSDSKQKLYKACTHVIKSAQTGPVRCGKPILRSTIPSLCTVHFQRGQKQISRALKKAGLNITTSSKLAPKFHVIVAESVRQIQAKRRAARRAIVDNHVVKEETTS